MFRWLRKLWDKITGREELLRKLEEKEKEIKELKEEREKWIKLTERFEKIAESYEKRLEEERMERKRLEEEYKKKFETLESEIKQLREELSKPKEIELKKENVKKEDIIESEEVARIGVKRDKINEIIDFLLSKDYFLYFIDDERKAIVKELIEKFGINKRVAYGIVEEIKKYLRKIRDSLDTYSKQKEIYTIEGLINSVKKSEYKLKKVKGGKRIIYDIKDLREVIKSIVFSAILKYGRNKNE
ncbi:MAG: hypothetical protein ACO2O4_05050 [Minisyncoccia bacterium]|jgi:DNA repair exonuclease SbcCD ATPase subunit